MTTDHTILMVDDDPEIIASLKRTLGMEPYTLITTTDPRRVAELLGRHRVSAVISDIEMPWINGIRVLEVTRAIQPWAGRIIVSGAGTLDLVVRAINEGAVHRYVEKPFDPHELRALVRTVVSTQTEVGELVARVEVRRNRRERLASEHPELMHVDRTEAGVYRLDSERAGRLVQGTAFEHLVRSKSRAA